MFEDRPEFKKFFLLYAVGAFATVYIIFRLFFGAGELLHFAGRAAVNSTNMSYFKDAYGDLPGVMHIAAVRASDTWDAHYYFLPAKVPTIVVLSVRDDRVIHREVYTFDELPDARSLVRYHNDEKADKVSWRSFKISSGSDTYKKIDSAYATIKKKHGVGHTVLTAGGVSKPGGVVSVADLEAMENQRRELEEEKRRAQEIDRYGDAVKHIIRLDWSNLEDAHYNLHMKDDRAYIRFTISSGGEIKHEEYLFFSELPTVESLAEQFNRRGAAKTAGAFILTEGTEEYRKAAAVYRFIKIQYDLPKEGGIPKPPSLTVKEQPNADGLTKYARDLDKVMNNVSGLSGGTAEPSEPSETKQTSRGYSSANEYYRDNPIKE